MIVLIIVVRQWARCGSDNGRTLVAASAVGLVDSPAVELFAVAEFVGLLLGILLFLKDVFLCLSLGLRVSLRPIPCERSSKRRPFQSQRARAKPQHPRGAERDCEGGEKRDDMSELSTGDAICSARSSMTMKKKHTHGTPCRQCAEKPCTLAWTIRASEKRVEAAAIHRVFCRCVTAN